MKVSNQAGTELPIGRVRSLLHRCRQVRVLVVGDAMLDHYIWGDVSRISPEAPVPVVRFERESFIPGGAANVARNLAHLGVQTALFGVVGADREGLRLRQLLGADRIDCAGLIALRARPTSVKTRIIARQQQVVRIDREQDEDLAPVHTRRLIERLRSRLEGTAAVIVCDYGKGVVTQALLDALKELCKPRGIWLSLDPKPVHRVDYSGFSLITPNRKEAFELAGVHDLTPKTHPLRDAHLAEAAARILETTSPALLLITLGELGMLLCRKNHKPVHIPTVAREVFDVSGAGDTVIATFTAAIAAGASPIEAAVIANHAAGIVVGKVGTATASVAEILSSFNRNRHSR